MPALAAIPNAAPPVGAVGYVLAWQLNLRAGPSLDYGVVAIARYGEEVTLIGRTADSIRLKVRPMSGQAEWT